jgi:hypothetical protein
MKIQLLAALIYEAYLAWRLDGKHFRDIKVGCKYAVFDGCVYWYSGREEWRGFYETWHEHSGDKPSCVLRMVRLGMYEAIPAPPSHGAESDE